ncbi:hypothetical protein [Rhizobium phaseoli]|uniref:hypothetical protein n=1 Tax=Rhizobium phaseoli TaxID=396 RepID=UPI002553448A|nr:hypothetical protein [Rhizobium phaseoli]MDK4727419.1 hypothetical protein [Rhizobium phaseoli]
MSTTTLNEPVLADDYPIYADYAYVVDGEVTISDYHAITAREFKARIGATEVRGCDLAGRGLLQECAV